MAPDLFSLQGLKNLGPTLLQWRDTWRQALSKGPAALGDLPQGAMEPIGYVLMQHAERLGRPTKAYGRWQERLPVVYRESVLGQSGGLSTVPDDNQIKSIKHYRSLMPMAMEARKPMFDLTAADGAIGAHQTSVGHCYAEFRILCERIATLVGL